MSKRLRVNPIACDAHGLCAELPPELVELDEWGYPIVSGEAVPRALRHHPRRAVAACPALALLLENGPASSPQGIGKTPDRTVGGGRNGSTREGPMPLQQTMRR